VLGLTQWQLAQRIAAARNTSIAFLHGTVFLPQEGMNSIIMIVPAIALDLKFDGSNELSRQLLRHLSGK
jgi:hypothetical protein